MRKVISSAKKHFNAFNKKITHPTIVSIARKMMGAEVVIGAFTMIGTSVTFVAVGQPWFAVGVIVSYLVSSFVKYIVARSSHTAVAAA